MYLACDTQDMNSTLLSSKVPATSQAEVKHTFLQVADFVGNPELETKMMHLCSKRCDKFGDFSLLSFFPSGD